LLMPFELELNAVKQALDAMLSAQSTQEVNVEHQDNRRGLS